MPGDGWAGAVPGVRWCGGRVQHRQRAARGSALRRWSCGRCVPSGQRAARGTSLSRWVPSATGMGWVVVGPARCLGVPPGRRPDRASTVGARSRDVASRFSFDEGFRSVGTNARPPEGLPTHPGHSAIGHASEIRHLFMPFLGAPKKIVIHSIESTIHG